MNKLVIYPGRFHPFHKGHLASYLNLVKKFGTDNVFVATSDKQEPGTSPFSFSDKQNMMAKLGVPVGKVVKVKNPYQAQEITKDFDPNTTAVIFALSQKDAERFNLAPKKDGSPSYMQPMPDSDKKLLPMSKHGYVLLTPTVTFKLPGTNANSASEVRTLYQRGNDAQRERILAALYGDSDKNIKEIFDLRLLPQDNITESKLNENSETFVMYLNNKPAAKFDNLFDVRQAARYMLEKMPNVDIKLKREVCTVLPVDLKENLKLALVEALLEKQSTDESADYISEKWSQKYKRSIDCGHPKGFSQRAHCAGRKKKA